MSFKVGSILYFDEYQFTDTGEIKKHFALTLLPEDVTKYQNSVLCSVITSKEPRSWGFLLRESVYGCFSCDSFACFNRRDLVSKSGLHKDNQPRGLLNKNDLEEAFKLLRKSLFVINDIASSQFFRGAIIYQWKKALGKIKT
jgi:hypothetical protein